MTLYHFQTRRYAINKNKMAQSTCSVCTSKIKVILGNTAYIGRAISFKIGRPMLNKVGTRHSPSLKQSISTDDIH